MKMDNEVNFNAFPKSYIQALTILYLNNQDLSEATPEDITNLYCDTIRRVIRASNDYRNQ